MDRKNVLIEDDIKNFGVVFDVHHLFVRCIAIEGHCESVAAFTEIVEDHGAASINRSGVSVAAFEGHHSTSRILVVVQGHIHSKVAIHTLVNRVGPDDL